MKSCIYAGRVRHRRFSPVPHTFSYRLFMMYVDLAELPTLFRGRWLWSVRRRTAARFCRVDHVGDPCTALDETIRALVAKRTGSRPLGPIRLLTHFRYFGYCFNPVSFYYCFDTDDRHIECIVAEVNNTPWGERHCYVMAADRSIGTGRVQRFLLNKEMHVSPFMPMDVDYDWRFGEPGERLSVHLENHREGKKPFDATLALERREISGTSLALTLFSYPFMTLKVLFAIHWQALRLWLKGVPFLVHPDKQQESEVRQA